MSAETLRRAAEKMRERAQRCIATADGAATWRPGLPDGYGNRPTVVVDLPDDSEPYMVAAGSGDEDTEHIASWHPAVALAVAKAMDNVALAWEICDDGWTLDMDGDAIRFEDTVDSGWLAVARAYLGSES